jgi:hypothetical protein
MLVDCEYWLFDGRFGERVGGLLDSDGDTSLADWLFVADSVLEDDFVFVEVSDSLLDSVSERLFDCDGVNGGLFDNDCCDCDRE